MNLMTYHRTTLLAKLSVLTLVLVGFACESASGGSHRWHQRNANGEWVGYAVPIGERRYDLEPISDEATRCAVEEVK